MREDTVLGTRIVEVHNGSSLFTGDAGKGASNLRQFIIENDLLEAIVAMPEKDFYNTGIGTFIWVITNRKEERRRGFVQLIDATEIKTPLRKNLGEKNCETTEEDRAQILQLLMDFKETPQSKIFPNNEFGYWSVNVYQPQRDEQGDIVRDKKGKPVIDKKSKDTEIIPFRYEGGIEGFFQNEILPYTPDAILDEKSIETGYELSFTKYFYKPKQLRTIEEISGDIRVIEERTDGLLDEIIQIKKTIAYALTKGLNPDVKMKDSKTPFFGMIPEHWEERKMKYCFSERSEKNHPKEPILCATQSQGVIPQSMYQNRVVVVNKGFEGLKFVKVGDFVISLRSFEGGIEYAYYQGIISAAYTILTPLNTDNADYFKLLFKCYPFIQVLQTCVTGIREGQNINYQMLGRKFIPIPPIDEQRAIVAYIDEKCQKIDTLMTELQAEIDYMKEYKQRLIADCVTGQVNVQNETI